MANYKQLFMNYMDREGIKYTDNGEFSVRIVYNGDNMQSIPVVVHFDKDGDNMVQFHCWEIGNFKDKFAAGVLAANEMNAKYRWVKFYIDDDKDMVCSTDAYIDYDSCGEECMSLVRRVVNITDEAYPTFMKALWS